MRKQEAEELYQAITLKHGLVIYGALNGPHRYPAFRRGLPTWISPTLSITSDELTGLLGGLEDALTE